MDCAVKMVSSSIYSLPKIYFSNYHLLSNSWFLSRKIGHEFHSNDTVFRSISSKTRGVPCTIGAVQRRSSLESLFCYDKAIPEEVIEKPIGLALFAKKIVGDNPRCMCCEAKGATLCTTCSGSGLYVESILESQGIIVKVRCLGCGGTGNIMCSHCGGRGHI